MVLDLARVVRGLQERLLASVAEYFLLAEATLSDRVRDAFLAVPRHCFVPRYRDLGDEAWQEVTDDDLLEHLPALYRDNGLAIGVDAAGEAVTISSPDWVLYLLELLNVQPGQRVFEVGAGSGWNAALLGQLAGPTGYVESFEIIPALAAQAERAVARAGLTNVRVVAGDAGAGSLDEEPFDRVIFTAGSYDVPAWLHGRVRLREHMDRRFDAIDQRFESVDRRFELADRRFDSVERQLGLLTDAVRTHSKALQAIETKLDGHEDRVRKLEGAAE